MNFDWNKYLSNEYCYPIEIVSVYDGDTITCNIDLGFKIKLYKQKIRLFGINTPEVRGKSRPEGLISKQKLCTSMMGYFFCTKAMTLKIIALICGVG